MTKRILIALGGTTFAATAIRRAVELASAHGASITAVPVIDTQSWKQAYHNVISGMQAARLADQQPWKAVKRAVDDAVGRLRLACEDAGVKHRVVEPGERPLDELVSQWRYHDLVVFGLRGLFDEVVLPDPHAAVADLITRGVRPILASPREYRVVRRVMIAYSGSQESAKTMKRFVQMRLWPDASVCIACFEMPSSEARTLLADAADYCRAHGLDPDTVHDPGPPAGRILAVAQEQQADLITLGDSFRSVLSRRILGDTAMTVIRQSPLPLFISH